MLSFLYLGDEVAFSERTTHVYDIACTEVNSSSICVKLVLNKTSRCVFICDLVLGTPTALLPESSKIKHSHEVTEKFLQERSTQSILQYCSSEMLCSFSFLKNKSKIIINKTVIGIGA